MSTIEWQDVYKHNDDIVTREIENEYILVPITSGIGDLDEEIYALNDTGRVIWEKLDGAKDLSTIKSELQHEFDADEQEIKRDIRGFVEELVKRNILVKIT